MNISLKGKTDEEAKALTLEQVQEIIKEHLVNKSQGAGRGRGRGSATKSRGTRGGTRGRGSETKRGGKIAAQVPISDSIPNENLDLDFDIPIIVDKPKKTVVITKKVI